MIDLPKCKHRGEESSGLFPCSSKCLVVPRRGVSAGVCLKCPFPNVDCSEQKERQRPSMLLGDVVSSALSLVGVTPEIVEKWAGGPCGCRERRQKMNQIDAWARRVVSGKAKDAKRLLNRIIGADDD